MKKAIVGVLLQTLLGDPLRSREATANVAASEGWDLEKVGYMRLLLRSSKSWNIGA